MSMVKIFMTQPEGSIVLATEDGVVVAQLDKEHPQLTCSEAVFVLIKRDVNRFLPMGLIGTQLIDEKEPAPPIIEPIEKEIATPIIDERPPRNASPINADESMQSTITIRRRK